MKRIVSIVICLLFVSASFVFSIADTSASSQSGHIVTFKTGEESTGTGIIDVETSSGSTRLSKFGDSTTVGAGDSMTLTVTADRSCVIREVKINGERKVSFADAISVAFSFDNLTKDMVIEVTYELILYKCQYSSQGRGSISVKYPSYYYNNDSSVYYGDTIVYHIEAEKSHEIIGVTVDGEELDLASFGKTSTNKMDSMDLVLEKITTSHKIDVLFSGVSVVNRNYSLTVSYDESRGICNDGINKLSVAEGMDYKIRVTPFDGYRVDKIIDGNDIITNFTGEYYTVKNITDNRAITIVFNKAESNTTVGTVGGSETTVDDPTESQIDTTSETIFAEPVETTADTVAWSGEYLSGDANCDGKVNVIDVTLIQKAVAGLSTLNDEQLDRADVDGDLQLTVKDATLIQKKIAFLITDFS